MTDQTLPNIDRARAALAARGITVHWVETDETYVDLWLTDPADDHKIILSWYAHVGWQLTEHYPDDGSPDTWHLHARDAQDLANQVAYYCLELCGPLADVDPDDIALLRRVIAWGRAHGWTAHRVGYIDARYESDATVGVGWDPVAGTVTVWRPAPGSGVLARDCDYPVNSVRQAIDVLVDLGILPDHLHRLASPEWQRMQQRLQAARDEREARRDRGGIGYLYPAAATAGAEGGEAR